MILIEKDKPILVAGATGYVGGRLIPALLEAGYTVRAMGRSLEKLACRPWGHHPKVELVQGDVLDVESLKKALSGCGAAYYLVHSMIAQKHKFVEADRKAAQNMISVAETTGIERMIYLGGLAEKNNGVLSKHLLSRIEVADILQSGRVPLTDLRAPMILGSGSASFEILRYLVERLPVMITPRWVRSLNQPIAIRNVVNYLVGCLEYHETIGQTYDIGGPDVLAYRDLLDIYAQEAQLPKGLWGMLYWYSLYPFHERIFFGMLKGVAKAIEKPVVSGPERFTPRLHDSCALPSRS